MGVASVYRQHRDARGGRRCMRGSPEVRDLPGRCRGKVIREKWDPGQHTERFKSSLWH